MINPLVSVIIPVFNTVRTLKRAVQSVCQQTYSNLELILIDDGSTDGSRELCDVLATKDCRIRTLHQPTNQGVEEARYRAIEETQGKYVMFCDSDDWMIKDIVEKCVEIAEREEVDAVHFQMHSVYDALGLWKQKATSRTKEVKLSQQEIMKDIYPSYFGRSAAYVPVWSFCFLKSLLEKSDIRPLGQKIGEDLMFMLRVMPQMKSLYLSKIYGYAYRHGGTTSKYHLWVLEEMKRLYHFELECIEKYNVEPTSFDFSAYELKNNFLHHIKELIILGEQKEDIIKFIHKELQDPVYNHLFEVYATKDDLSAINQTVKTKDAEKMVMLLTPIAQKHKRKRQIKKILTPILDIL
jgi:glycoside transferase family 2 protein